MSKVIDITKLSRQGLKSPKKIKYYHNLDNVVVDISFLNSLGELSLLTIDPNNPFTSLNSTGRRIAINYLNSAICYICKQDPEVATEYLRMLEKAQRYLRDTDAE